VVVLVLGVLTVIAFYLPIADLQMADSSAAAVAMKSMHMNRMQVFWSFPLLQAAGLAALVWAYIGIVLGLMESGAAARWRWLPLTAAQRGRLHRHVSLLVIGLILVHILSTAFDAMGDNLLTVLVPWQESWSAAILAYNLGIFAFYLALLVGPTYYIRRRIGTTRWRIIHRLAVIVYILSIWHALIIGADIAYYPWIRPLMWLLQIPLLLLLVRRVLEQARTTTAFAQATGGSVSSRRTALVLGTCYAIAAVAALATAAIIAIVATGASNTVVTSIQF